MNEDKMISVLSNLDDDLLEKEIDFLMGEVACDMESINKKAQQKLEKYKRKTKLKKRLPYAAAACLCLICINTVYADEISQAVKSFFNKTPVYSTMVDGKAYYLENSLVLDDNLTIDSMIVSESGVEMECTSQLANNILGAMTIIPEDIPDAQYIIGVYMKESNNKYYFTFADGKEKSFNIIPFKDFVLLVNGKTYSITLTEAKSLNDAQKLTVGHAASSEVDLVTIGANGIEKNGKQAVQLIASFKNEDIKLGAFGQPVEPTAKIKIENLSDGGRVGSSTSWDTKEIYATDKSGAKHKLTVPTDAHAWPITTFETDAAIGSPLTVNLPALLATYENSLANIRINIPQKGETLLNQDIDLIAQKAVVKSIKRLSPTSAELTFQLNTGADKYVSIYYFLMLSEDVRTIAGEFSGDQATATLEFDNNVNAFVLDISRPTFVVKGNWTINMK
jgi:hypothetical protein